MTNAEMANALDLMQTLNETGKLGYAIARNMRILKTEATEYLQLRAELFQKYGEQVEDRYIVPTEKAQDFLGEMGDIPAIEHEVNVYKVDEDTFASGTLTAPQMEALLWMVEEE